jgi:uncharacterized membrane protein
VNGYLLLKVVHILSSALLFGTGLGTAFFMWQAHRSGDVGTIARVSRNVVLADWFFTTPAVIVQPLTGLWMVTIAGYPLEQRWIASSLVLYVLVGLCWLPVVWLQICVRELSNAAAANGQALPAIYNRYMQVWFWLGWPAFIGVLVIFWLMVAKPA